MNYTTPAQEWMNTVCLSPENNQRKENFPSEKQAVKRQGEHVRLPSLLQLLHQGEKQAPPLREKCYEKGTYLFLPEDKANQLFLIVDGRVKIGQYSESGQEIINAILTNEELFGVRALAEGQSRQEYAFAMEQTRCLVLYPQELKALVHKQPGLSIYIMEQLAFRMLVLEKRLGALTFQNSKTRILKFLYELGCQQGQRVGYELIIRKFMTQKEIARLTSTSR